MHFFAKKERKSVPAWLGGLGIFLAVFAIYAWVQRAPTFLDPDSFYHLKMAELLMTRGIVRDFTWLPFTTLAHAYADHHFLYHVLLVPFIAAFGPFVGVKISTALFGAVALTSFYALLRTLGAKWPAAFTLLLATSSSFMFRMNLAKTSSLSVTLLMLALITISKNKPWVLFALSWAYVWLYGGWPIMGVVVGTFLFARLLTDVFFEKHPVHSWASPWFWRRLFGPARNARADFFGSREVRQALAAAGGLVAGVVVNPFFPANVRFYWVQIVQIAVIGTSDKIGVGTEWYPFPPFRLLAESGAIFMAIAVCIALLVAMMFWDELSRTHAAAPNADALAPLLAALCLAVLFLLLTMRSRRHIEYFAPFATLATALVFSQLARRLDTAALAEKIRWLFPWRPVPMLLAAYLACLFAFLGGRDVLLVGKSFQGGHPFMTYAKAAAWLKANVPPGEVVVHSDWDDFPMLFLQDDTHRYIAGLDATFLYRQDPQRYWSWVNVTTGKTDAMADTMLRDFGSHTAIVENDHTAMLHKAQADPALVAAYHDDEVSIFVIPRTEAAGPR